MNSKEILKKHKMKITPARVDVLNVLFKERCPLAIEDIKSKLQEDINTTTVYRILSLLVEKGIICQINFHDAKAYFEYQIKHHHHITCTSCNKREEIDVCVKNDIKNILTNSKEFDTVNEHTLEFFSVCKECKK